jgi:hypothetical protein
MSEDPTAPETPAVTPAEEPAPATVPAAHPAVTAPVAVPAQNHWRWAPWWHYLVVGVIGIVLGALICGGLLGIADHFDGHRGGPGRFQRFGPGPGVGRVGPGPRQFGPGGVTVRPCPVAPPPLRPVPSYSPAPAPTIS